MIGIFGSLGKLTLFVFNTKFNVECQEFSLFLAGVFVCVCVFEYVCATKKELHHSTCTPPK